MIDWVEISRKLDVLDEEVRFLKKYVGKSEPGLTKIRAKEIKKLMDEIIDLVDAYALMEISRGIDEKLSFPWR